MGVKMYFRGGANIKHPKDVNGVEIKEGDIITFNWFREKDGTYSMEYWNEYHPNKPKEEIDEYVNTPKFLVRKDEDGILYGDGLTISNETLGTRMYLHDFEFKYTKRVTNIKDNPELWVE